MAFLSECRTTSFGSLPFGLLRAAEMDLEPDGDCHSVAYSVSSDRKWISKGFDVSMDCSVNELATLALQP